MVFATPTVRLAIDIEPDLAQRFAQAVRDDNRSKRSALEEALQLWLERRAA